MSPKKRSDGRRRRRPTKWQKARADLLEAAGKDRNALYAAIGGSVSWQTMVAVLDGRFRNPKVIETFSALTGATAETAFPTDEPPYRSRSQTTKTAPSEE